MLCLIPGILASSFFPMCLGYMKSPLLGDGEGEQVEGNSQGGSKWEGTAAEQIWRHVFHHRQPPLTPETGRERNQMTSLRQHC